MLQQKRTVQFILIGLAATAAIIALLVYYQSQGLIKIFPDAHDRQIKAALQIDEKKFSPAEGLKPEVYQDKIKEVYTLRDAVKANQADQNAWFSFGLSKDFLNDHVGAAAAWEIAHELQPYDFRTTLNLANAYQYFIKDQVKAEKYYLVSLELRPDLTNAYQGLMDLYHFNVPSKRAEYEPLVLKAIKNDPQNIGAYYGNLVEFFARKDNTFYNLTKAKEYLAQVKKYKPTAVQDLETTYPELKS